jgi:hypothetical protein
MVSVTLVMRRQDVRARTRRLSQYAPSPARVAAMTATASRRLVFESSQRITAIPAAGIVIPPGKWNLAAVLNR